MHAYDPSEVDMDLIYEAREQRRRERRMFAYCSECMSNGHRPGCPEATDQQQDEDLGETA